LPSSNVQKEGGEIRFAFDGDAVLFSDEAERVYKTRGLDAFAASEKAAAHEPLSGGPFKPFLQALQSLQAEFTNDTCPIRTALVTARSAPAHERVIRTLRAWQIRIDESLFLGGLAKGEFLRAYGADVFFDDQQGHCDSASQHVPTGHVPHGVANE
jgi:5'-nucleotidase